MCGIVGFIGNDNAYEKILNGLIQLQNRGYDSAGISVMDKGIKTWKHASEDSVSALFPSICAVTPPNPVASSVYAILPET